MKLREAKELLKRIQAQDITTSSSGLREEDIEYLNLTIEVIELDLLSVRQSWNERELSELSSHSDLSRNYENLKRQSDNGFKLDSASLMSLLTSLTNVTENLKVHNMTAASADVKADFGLDTSGSPVSIATSLSRSSTPVASTVSATRKAEPVQPSSSPPPSSIPVSSPGEYPGFVDGPKSSSPDDSLDDKYLCVKAYLQRWAEAEKYEATGKKIGYQQHLDYLEENWRLKDDQDAKKKAETVLNWYAKLPGFGYRVDSQYHVRLHNHQKLLKLELKGLKSRGADQAEIAAKQEEINDLEKNYLEPHLRKMIHDIRERMNEKIAEDPENEQYVKPIVDRYISWLRGRNKSGKPGFTVMDGPPGTGKTYFGETIAEVLGLSFQKAAMSSESDSSLIKGRGKGWDDPKPGRGAEFMDKAGSQAFLWFPDELEKAEKDVVNQHVDLFEDEQRSYEDELFNKVGVPCDFIPYIATTNDMMALPSHIRSRAQVVVMKGKAPDEKVGIMVRKFNKIIDNDVTLTGKTIDYGDHGSLEEFMKAMLNTYSTEPGFREDNRNIDAIASSIADYFARNPSETSMTVNLDYLEGPPPIIAKPPASFIRMRDFRVRCAEQINAYAEGSKNLLSGASVDSDEELKKMLMAKHSITNLSSELVLLLESELRDKPQNGALLRPDIQDQKRNILTYSRYTSEEVNYISRNLDKLESIGTTKEELYKKTEQLIEDALANVNDFSRQIREKRVLGQHAAADRLMPELVKAKEYLDLVRGLRSSLEADLKAGVKAPRDDVDSRVEVDAIPVTSTRVSPGPEHSTMSDASPHKKPFAFQYGASSARAGDMEINFHDDTAHSPPVPRVGMSPDILRHLKHVGGGSILEEFKASPGYPADNNISRAMSNLIDWAGDRDSRYKSIDVPESEAEVDKKAIASGMQTESSPPNEFKIKYDEKDEVRFRKDSNIVKADANVSSLRDAKNGDKFIANILEVAAKVYLETGREGVVIRGLENSPDIAANFLEAAAALAHERNISLKIKFDAPTLSALMKNEETKAHVESIAENYPSYRDKIESLASVDGDMAEKYNTRPGHKGRM